MWKNLPLFFSLQSNSFTIISLLLDSISCRAYIIPSYCSIELFEMSFKFHLVPKQGNNHLWCKCMYTYSGFPEVRVEMRVIFCGVWRSDSHFEAIFKNTTQTIHSRYNHNYNGHHNCAHCPYTFVKYAVPDGNGRYVVPSSCPELLGRIVAFLFPAQPKPVRGVNVPVETTPPYSAHHGSGPNQSLQEGRGHERTWPWMSAQHRPQSRC